MRLEIYLDNNATTRCDPDILEAMLPYFDGKFGNSSSIYSFGRTIKDDVESAREKVAKLLNAHPDDIIFTSCASESNVAAIMNAVRNNPSKKHIITTQVEHASILETMHFLEHNGYHVTYLSVDKKGNLNLEEFVQSIDDDTLLVAVMMANNEVGNIYPIKEMARIAREKNILFHCDAVQAIGKMKIDVLDLGIDTLSLSGHKIHAPKGIGVLYIKDSSSWKSLVFGHQEGSRRGGTENVPYIIGLGKAVDNIIKDDYKTNQKIGLLRDRLEEKIRDKIDDVWFYGDLDNRLPNTTSVAFKGVKAEELLLVLDSFQIFVSTGSACNSELAEPSHVLVACGADLENYSPIRVSLSKYNTEEEIDLFVKQLIRAVSMLRRKK